MIRLPRLSACALASLLAAGLHAQSAPPECPAGEADEQGIHVDMTVAAHPTRVANTLDSLLTADGYVFRSPAAVGRWQIQPRFTYSDAVRDEAWVRDPHPGVQLGVEVTEEKGDSVQVQVGAWTLCQPQVGGDEGRMLSEGLELLSAAGLVADLTERLDSLEAAGVDLRAAVERPGTTLPVPEEVAGFRLVNQEDYDDARLGTGLRYARPDGFYLDAYVYPGPPADTCDAACARARVDAETEEFTAGFPEYIQRGYYTRMDVRASDAITPPAGAPWLAGRHLRMEVLRPGSQTPMESDFILYAFPGFMVKVRATYPPSTKTEGAVRAFAADLLTQLVP